MGGQEFQWGIMVSNFERVYPQYQINLSSVPTATYYSVLNTQLAGGNAPDLFVVRPGTGQLGSVIPYAQAGRVANLSGRPWNKRVLPQMVSGVTLNKKIYAWPMDISIQGLLYNKDTFAKLKLTVPQKFVDILSLCKKAIAAGVQVPIAFPAAVGAADQVAGISQATQQVYSTSPDWNDLRNQNKVTFMNTPGWHQALQRVQEMKQVGCFGPQPAGIQLNQAVSMFASGSSPMLYYPSFVSAQVLQANPSMNLGYMIVPANNAKNTVVPATGNTDLAVNAASGNKQVALTFVDFVARSKQNSTFAKAEGAITGFDVAHGVVPSYMDSSISDLVKQGKIYVSINQNWINPAVYSTDLALGVQGLDDGPEVGQRHPHRHGQRLARAVTSEGSARPLRA